MNDLLLASVMAIAFIVYVLVLQWSIRFNNEQLKKLPDEKVLLPAYPKLVLTILGGVLAINTGAVLGIEFSGDASPSIPAAGPTAEGAPEKEHERSTGSKVQIGAAILYVCSLLAVAVGWTVNKWNPNYSETLSAMATNLIGVLAGSLTQVLA